MASSGCSTKQVKSVDQLWDPDREWYSGPPNLNALAAAEEHMANSKWGYFLYIMCYIIWAVPCLPQVIIEAVAGYVFPFWEGLLVATIGRAVATFVMCYLGRQCMRAAVDRLVVGKHTFLRALISVINRQPWKAAALISAAEIPLSVKNYPWSITEAPIGIIMLAQTVCQTPACIFTVWVGHTSADLVDVFSGDHSSGTVGLVVTIIGLVLAVLLLMVLGVYTKRELDHMVEEEAMALGGPEAKHNLERASDITMRVNPITDIELDTGITVGCVDGDQEAIDAPPEQAEV